MHLHYYKIEIRSNRVPYLEGLFLFFRSHHALKSLVKRPSHAELLMILVEQFEIPEISIFNLSAAKRAKREKSTIIN